MKEREKSDNYIQFESLLSSINAFPQIQTQYKRLVFFSTLDDYTRIAFDKHLIYKPNNSYDFNISDMINYDHNYNFDPDTNIILELKCTTKVPVWFLDTIKIFDLEKSSFSKYAGAMLELIPNDQS